MSQRLVSSVPPSQVLPQLLQLEEAGENAPAQRDIDIQHGPFGVFKQSHPRIAEVTPPELTAHDDPREESASLTSQTSVYPSDEAEQEWSQSLIESILQDCIPEILSPSFDICHSMDSVTSPPNGLGVADMEDVEELAPIGYSQDVSGSLPSQQTSDYPELTIGAGWESYMLPGPVSIQDNIPCEAVFLLKHFTTDIVSCITPFEHTKTPWHILFIPHIKGCLAAITIGEDLCHASLVAFFGTLAISAFSLSGRSLSTRWLELAKIYEKRALYHAHHTLLSAYDVPKVAKYKSILMGILTLVSLFGLTSNRKQFEFFTLEAEKFIRLRGLNRKKSRKVRLLHHCYAFQRIFYESLCISNTNSKHRREVEMAAGASGFIVGQDSLVFRLPNWNNLSQEMLAPKTQEEGENDLHLERPGVWPATLYPEIFGIPEKLVLFLSLAIRLGNEKDATGQRGAPSSINLQEFLSRAKALENCFIQVQESADISTAQIPRSSRTDLAKLVAIISATQQALEIYFYRRIYDLDASLLQAKVEKVLDSITRLQCASSTFCGSLCMLWPAFVAACEADDPKLQRSFSVWFESCAQSTGLSIFIMTLGLVKESWVTGSSSNSKRGTWIDLWRKKGW